MRREKPMTVTWLLFCLTTNVVRPEHPLLLYIKNFFNDLLCMGLPWRRENSLIDNVSVYRIGWTV
jgi:hypothetical protein